MSEAKTELERQLYYRSRPIEWAVDYMGIDERTLRWSMNPAYDDHTWDGDKDPLVQMANALADGNERRIAVTSAIGTGKTFSAGWLAIWFCDCYRPSFVATIAPKEDQLKENLWAEIDSKFWPKFSELHERAEKLSLEIRMRPDENKEDTSGRSDWKVVGYVAGVGAEETTAVKARGFHQEHMLIIFEEMTGVNEAVVEAFKDTCVAPHNVILGIGNADDENDPLSRMARRDSTKHITISAYDHPNIVMDNPRFIPGAATQTSVDDLLEEAGGDRTDSRFQSRARGLIPTVSSRSLYKENELKEAKKHLRTPKKKIEHTHRDGIEGFTEIYYEPDENYLSQYILAMDVAGESDRDYHAAVMWNRNERRPDAIIRMRGIGPGYVEAALSLCERFKVPNEEGKWAYPLMAWETNGVGQHFPRVNIDHPDYDSLKEYPNIYFRKNLDASGASPRKTWGWYTTGGQSGNRHKMIEELKIWARELAYYPERMVSEYIYEEAKHFIKQEHRGKQKYMAASGHHDDLQMALGMAMVLDNVTREPIKAQSYTDDSGNQLCERAMRAIGEGGQNEDKDPWNVEMSKF